MEERKKKVGWCGTILILLLILTVLLRHRAGEVGLDPFLIDGEDGDDQGDAAP